MDINKRQDKILKKLSFWIIVMFYAGPIVLKIIGPIIIPIPSNQIILVICLIFLLTGLWYLLFRVIRSFIKDL